MKQDIADMTEGTLDNLALLDQHVKMFASAVLVLPGEFLADGRELLVGALKAQWQSLSVKSNSDALRQISHVYRSAASCFEDDDGIAAINGQISESLSSQDIGERVEQAVLACEKLAELDVGEQDWMKFSHECCERFGAMVGARAPQNLMDSVAQVVHRFAPKVGFDTPT